MQISMYANMVRAQNLEKSNRDAELEPMCCVYYHPKTTCESKMCH